MSAAYYNADPKQVSWLQCSTANVSQNVARRRRSATYTPQGALRQFRLLTNVETKSKNTLELGSTEMAAFQTSAASVAGE